MTEDDVINTALTYADHLIGKPYTWGAKGPSSFDCSGFIYEVLKAVGIHPTSTASPNAQQLFNYYFALSATQSLITPKPGSLVFYGPSPRVDHVALSVNDWVIIESGGGDETTINVIAADNLLKNAGVRYRRFDHRKDLVKILMPKYL